MPSGKKLIIIVGPTASGKSALAVRLAKNFNGEIVSADSRQVYRGLDIGSGKIRKNEKQNIPHYLLDHASPRRVFTVSQYQKLAQRKITEIWQRGKIPILVGGTGFYIQAVVDGINFPAVPPNLNLRRQLKKKSTDELFNQLKKLDPFRAKKIDAQNPHRLIRAIEIATALGKVPKLKTVKLKTESLFIGLRPPPAVLKRKIKLRLLARFRQGLIAEVKKLKKDGLSWQRLDDLGLEYRRAAEYLQGKITKKELVARLENEILAYTRRQLTWFKRDKRIVWSYNQKEIFILCRKFLGLKAEKSSIRAASRRWKSN